MFEDFNNLPEELKQATIKANTAFKRYAKARRQVEIWTEERDLAGQDHTTSAAQHAETLNRWDPETNTMKEVLEEKVQAS